jgi:diguanylate cyclase (GGDEF)-like protein/PAS domain S-box-containing protein
VQEPVPVTAGSEQSNALSGYSAALSREMSLLVDREGVITWCDNRAIHIMGAEAGRALATYMPDSSPEKLGRFLVHSLQRRTAGWEFVVLAQGEPVTFEFSGVPYDGSALVVGAMLPPNYQRALDEMAATLSQLAALQRETHQQRQELQLLAARLGSERHLLHGILNRLPSGVRVVDPSSRQVILANERLREILGRSYEPGERIEFDLRSATSGVPRGRPEDIPIARTLISGQPVINESIQIVASNGEPRDIQVSTTAIEDDNGEISATVEVFHDVTELKRLQRRLEHDNLHDALTGLPNRRLFMDRLRQAFRTARRRDTKIAVMFLDLDDFKEINDTLGHAAGDEVLKSVGNRLEHALRESDTIARLSGDEFVVLLEDVGGEEESRRVAERILQSFRQPIDLGDREWSLTVSVGIALNNELAPPDVSLIELADRALYEAKRLGKSRIHVYSGLETRTRSMARPSSAGEGS